MHISSAGFVLRLRNGRRAYLDFQHWHAFEQDEDFRIEIEFLEGKATLPTFPSPEEPFGGWSDETSHLNKVFAG
jgi:bacillopeptidase F (M6 metalloprotease family)